jgi:hydrogenase maturation factor
VNGPACITCGDVALEMRVVDVDAETGLAVCVSDEGEEGQVEIGLVEPVAAGDRVLVHACVALTRLDDYDRPEAGQRHQTAGQDAPRR